MFSVTLIIPAGQLTERFWFGHMAAWQITEMLAQKCYRECQYELVWEIYTLKED